MVIYLQIFTFSGFIHDTEIHDHELTQPTFREDLRSTLCV